MKAKIRLTKTGTERKGRTILLSKKYTPNAAKWVKWLEEHCLSSAGPRPNVIEMRHAYWGNAALLVRAGQYVYLIDKHDDGRRMPWE